MTDKKILIDIPMPITTPRLVLRPFSTGDGKILYEAKNETIDDLLEWMDWAKKGETEEDNEIVCRQAHAKFILREDLMFLGFHRETGEMVISTGLHRFDFEIGKFEIGYWVRKKFQGQGYATESSNALTRYAFDQFSAKRMLISHADGNDKSSRVPLKLNFEKETVRKLDHKLPDGRIVDTHDYVCFNTNDLPPLEVTWT